jgi:hypothetical protein
MLLLLWFNGKFSPVSYDRNSFSSGLEVTLGWSQTETSHRSRS